MGKFSENGEIFDRRKKLNTKFKRTDERILVKNKSELNIELYNGRIVEVKGKIFVVRNLDSSIDLSLIECASSGTFYTYHDNSTLLTVGDYVNFSIDSNQKLGKIHAVDIRDTWFSRKPLIGVREDVIAANIKYAAIIASCDEPLLNPRLIDRLIVAAEIGNIIPFLIINKSDLSDIKIIKNELRVYKQMGYTIFFTSLTNKSGLSELINYIDGKELLLIGQSGVGKSSLVNYLSGIEVQKTATISNKSNKGKHATSFSKLFDINNTTIIDTPGIREFGIVKIAKEELMLYFKDFANYYEHCRFMPCTHTHEPDCEIKQAVENGKIDSERYQSYLNIFESL